MLAAVGASSCIAMGLAGQPHWWWSAAMAGTLSLRRTAPVVFASTAAAVSLGHLLVDASLLFPGDAVLLAAAYSVAAHGRGRRRLAGPLLGAVYVAVLIWWTFASAMAPVRGSAGLVVGVVSACFVAAWSAGVMERRRAEALQDAQHRRMLSERDADARSRIAAYEAREHISDEMHDVLAHTLTGIVVQAESGRAISPPGESADLFTTIAETSRSALVEVRGLLAPPDGVQNRPTPGLKDLDDLIDGFRTSGLRVHHETRGEPARLSAGLSLAVYRVVQESLTNALRHGDGLHARLTFEWTPELLTATVSNPLEPGLGTAALQEHRGLAGMRRRCVFYGGSARYEARSGSFTVVATWPLAAAQTAVSGR